MTIETMRDIMKRIPSMMGAYESPAEECLGERLRPAVSSSASFQTQVWVETFVGRFRLDILLTDCKGRRIAVEVDGKDFHDPVRDHWRTVFIIGDGQADVVYRVPASDLKNNLVGVLAGLAALEPMCFSQEAILQWREATDESLNNLGNEDERDEGDEDPGDRDDDGERGYRGRWFGSSMAIESHFRGDARDCAPATIKIYYDFAAATGLTDVDAIQEAWKLKYRPVSNLKESDDIFDFFDLS